MADELRIKMLAENRLSEELKDANKAVRDLKKELVAAAKEAESSGDFSKYRQLEDAFQDASRRAGELRGELKRVQRETKATGDQTVKSAGVMKTAWSKLQKVTQSPLFTAVSIGAVTLFARAAIQSFAEVEDASSALQSTFGSSGDRIIAWANETAIAFNLSQREALTAAQTMAVFGDSAGLAGQDLETFAISLTERAAEAASYFGGTTADAITAFGAALRGENEPIRKYGVLLDDATLRAKAFEMGLTEASNKALTPQQKTLAAYNVIMEQTTRVQGDVARTSDSMANQIKQSQAQMENFKSTVGETLAVGLAPILGALNGVLSAFNGLPQPIKTVAVAMGVLGTAALILGPRIAAITAEMRAAGVTATGMTSKMKGAAMFMGGPWGAALAVATIALTHFLMEQAEASARVDEFASNIDSVTGKLNSAGVARIAEQLLGDISEDDWKTLDRLGISVEDATAAVIGGADAWEAFRIKKAEAVNRAGVGSEKGLLATLEGNVMGLRSEVQRGEEAWRAATRATAIAEGGLEDVAYTSGTVEAAMRRVNPLVGEYRDKAWSASYAASALKTANQNAATATDNLSRGLEGLQATISEQQALAAYQTSLETFIADPSAATASAVAADMATAAAAIQDPGDRAKFTKRAIDDIRTAASDAGMKLNPELDKGLLRARGQARLLETQIDRAVRARVVDITLRFSDSRTTYGGQGDGPRHGGYTDGWITKGSGGPTSDLAPIWASRGEYVLRAGAAAALRNALGDSGLYALNHADRSMPSFLDSPVPPIVSGGGSEPALVGAGAPVINIGEIKADSGIDVQSEVLWALRRHERIKRERS
jgi:hypothetical protein